MGLEVIRAIRREHPPRKNYRGVRGGAYVGLETLKTAKAFGAIEAIATHLRPPADGPYRRIAGSVTSVAATMRM
jgi:hypothetical protein